jgi:hypothetical protein
MWSRIRTLAGLAITAGATMALPLSAQAPAPLALSTVPPSSVILDHQTNSSVATPVAGPRRDGLKAGLRADEARRTSEAPPALMQERHKAVGTPLALMVVGVAGLLTGAIVGDTPGTIIMVGGAVIGLWGLFQFLQ